MKMLQLLLQFHEDLVPFLKAKESDSYRLYQRKEMYALQVKNPANDFCFKHNFTKLL